MVEKCTHCGKDFIIRNLKKYYAYKLREYRSHRICFFCSYSCMRTAKKEHPEKYARGRDK